MTTVITYGTFDLIHYGHLNLLKRASQLGDRLIVGVSTDEMCLTKGKKPVFNYEENGVFVRFKICGYGYPRAYYGSEG